MAVSEAQKLCVLDAVTSRRLWPIHLSIFMGLFITGMLTSNLTAFPRRLALFRYIFRGPNASLNHVALPEVEEEKGLLSVVDTNSILHRLPVKQAHSQAPIFLNGTQPDMSASSSSSTRTSTNISTVASLVGGLASRDGAVPVNRMNCDVFMGRWVQDNSYPLYQPASCPFVDEAFSCQQNGRPDSNYTRWKWVPRDCNVPRLNGTRFLEIVQGKRVAFVGDSLNRNQWESLLCILREVLPDKTRIVQIQGGHISKLPGAYAFRFLDYDCQIEFYTSHYLVDEELTYQNKSVIRLDKIDKSEQMWREADVLVFNTGHWWTPDKIGQGENCFQEKSEIYSKLDVMLAYRKSLLTWAAWVDKHVNPVKTMVFFRGYSPTHYIGGQWNSGGQCHNESDPIFNESYLTAYPDKMEVVQEVIAGMSVPVHVVNITRLSDFRKDAHPAIYGRPFQEKKAIIHQDCSHWCLPGLPDIWNELLFLNLLA